MLELTDRLVSTWASNIGVGDRRLAELDLRLVDLLGRHAENKMLRGRTALKGGTAINKLHLGGAARLSVHLDHNALGSRDEVQGARRQLRDEVLKTFSDQDPTFSLSHDHSWEMVRVTGRYQPLSGAAPEKVKVKISMVERIPLLGTVEMPLRSLDGPVHIRTYHLEELLATKWRAFYARSKGRDLFDLVTARPMIKDPDLLRKMTLYYFLRGGVEFDPDAIRANIAEKGRNRAFETDLKTYLRGDLGFATQNELATLMKTYDFLFQLDRTDHQFLLLSRYLLGKVGRSKAGPLGDEREPLRVLFGGLDVAEAALRSPSTELVPFAKQKKQKP